MSVLEERLGNLRLDNFIGKHTQLSKTSIENYGCFSYDLGVFNINRSISYDSLGSLNVKNDFFLGVYVSLFKSPSGFFIITYYFFMSDKATDLIKDVDVSGFECFREFIGLNIYKRKNRALRTIDRRTQAMSYIEDNIQKVVDAAKDVIGLIGERIGVTPIEFIMSSEYYKDQDEPYFNDSYIPESPDGEEIYYIGFSKHNQLNYSDDPAEQFFKEPPFKKAIFDFSYLLCKRQDTFEQFDNYLQRYYQCYENHLVFLPLYMVHKKISQIIERVSNIISNEKSADLAKHHDIVYECLSQTEAMKKWLGEIEADYKYNSYEKYFKALENIIKTQKARVSELFVSTKTFYALSENRVQVENIKYSKRNSRLVFWLVIIQIFLAAMTIDLFKKEQWYSGLVNFIFS
ncbi:hypothetical protein CDT93_18235 [Cronobacter sakazakii]|nr:hypothetical protein CDT87_15320 [Cronobacter sakazakii]PQV91061.1 hypothetical protein CDT93_18235 [Cronobacter sakazakii]PQX96566.1 hypothetical protein C5940_05220 [Cronobacter sakazakii]